MNQTDPKFPQIRSLSKPVIRKSASPNQDSSIQDIPSLFACQNELERTKEEIFHLKKAIHKKTNEITQTKADITRYEETLKKNLKIIENISLTTDKSTSIAIGKLLFDPNQSKLPTEISLSPCHIVKFKELLAVNLLKSKNKELSEAISNKTTEINVLKNDSKTNSITKLENTFLLNATELKELKINYDSLQMKYKEMYAQAEKIIEERDQLKIDMNKFKSEYLFSKAKLSELKSNKILKSNINDSFIMNEKKASLNTCQHTKEQSDVSSNKRTVDNGIIMVNVYLSEKAKLEKKLEELCNANLDADEKNEANESQLKKKIEEYNVLLEKSKKMHYEFEAKKRDSDKEETLKKQIEKLKNEKNMLNDKINNIKEIDLTKKIIEVKERMKEIESEIQEEKNKNIELKETIESDKINEKIVQKKIEDDQAKIEIIKKEIEELKQQKLESKRINYLEEKENFFATGLNINVKSRYDNFQKEEPVNEQEERDQNNVYLENNNKAKDIQKKEKLEDLEKELESEENTIAKNVKQIFKKNALNEKQEKEIKSQHDTKNKEDSNQLQNNFDNKNAKELNVEQEEEQQLQQHNKTQELNNENNIDNLIQERDDYHFNSKKFDENNKKE